MVVSSDAHVAFLSYLHIVSTLQVNGERQAIHSAPPPHRALAASVPRGVLAWVKAGKQRSSAKIFLKSPSRLHSCFPLPPLRLLAFDCGIHQQRHGEAGESFGV
jgi:hypothetical protein